MNLQHITDGTNRSAMHNIVDKSYCVVLIYADENYNYKTTAATLPGAEDGILNCVAHAVSRMQGMIENQLDDPKDFNEKGGDE